MNFESITEKSLNLALDIMNSNPTYNMIENGNPVRTIKEVRSELLNSTTNSYLIKMNEEPIGIIDFLDNNPKDNHPWIGLLMIHGAYHSLGYGKKAYVAFEESLKQQHFKKIRLGVLDNNEQAKRFWRSVGYSFYGKSELEGKVVDCFEKKLE